MVNSRDGQVEILVVMRWLDLSSDKVGLKRMEQDKEMDDTAKSSKAVAVRIRSYLISASRTQ